MPFMRKFGYCSLLSLIALAGCGGSGDGARTAPTQTVGSAQAGLVNGDLSEARFSNPVNVAVASDGTVYVADFDNDAVRAISPGGMVSTLTKQDNFSRPFGMTMSANGQLYVQTDANDLGQRDATTGTVWRIDRATGAPTVVARNLGRPRGIAAMADGRIACSDLSSSTVYILDPRTGNVTPLAGTAGSVGFANGNGTAAKFDRPYGLAVMSDGSLIVADQNNNRLRKVTMGGDVTTFAGTGGPGSGNGSLSASSFNHPEGVTMAPDGTMYVSDHDNFVIRRIRNGQVSTFAGSGVQGFADGVGTMAQFFGIEGLAVSPDGRNLWIADGNNGDGGPYNRVRRFSAG